MSAFEDFIQTELPLRPYVAVNPAEETIAVRRGAGPRQLGFIELTEGQVLAKVNGQLVGVNLGGTGGLAGVRSFVLEQTVAASTWVVNHNKGSEFVIVQCLDDANKVIIPEDITITDENTVTISLNMSMTGKIYCIFLD